MRLKYCYNVAGVHHFFAESAAAIPAGEHQVRMEFAYAGGGLGKGGKVTLHIDGKKVGEGAVPMTQAMIFSADDGWDTGAPVSPEHGPHGNGFNGTVKGVQLAIADAAESPDHMIERRMPSGSPWRASSQAPGTGSPQRAAGWGRLQTPAFARRRPS